MHANSHDVKNVPSLRLVLASDNNSNSTMAASFADYSRAASLGEIEPTRHVDPKSERRRRMPVFEVGRGGAGQLECGVSHFGAFHVGEEEEGDWGETAAGLRLLSISNASSAAPVPTTDVPAVPSGFEPPRLILPLLLCIHPVLLLRLRHLAQLLPQSTYLHLPPTTVYRFTVTRHNRFHSISYHCGTST
ncbi:hypothetical protein BDQ17DRAFT_1430111 [Cyathus striatus]|nr:hypothetical protein BDQ17DRAFT_1430111 [Cyathus striatus]